MLSIRHIALADAHHHTLVAVIIQIEHHGRRTSCGCAPDDAQTGSIPDKVVRPLLAARIEEWDNGLCLWIATFDTIATPFIAVATS